MYCLDSADAWLCSGVCGTVVAGDGFGIKLIVLKSHRNPLLGVIFSEHPSFILKWEYSFPPHLPLKVA